MLVFTGWCSGITDLYNFRKMMLETKKNTDLFPLPPKTRGLPPPSPKTVSLIVIR